MMKYLLIVSHVPPSGVGGGMVRYATEFARELAGTTGVELHVAVAAGSETIFEEIVPASHVWRVIGRSTVGRSVAECSGIGFPPLERFDVVHGTKHLVPMKLGKKSRKPLRVLTAHDMLLFDRARDYPITKRVLLRTPYARSLRASDLILADSQATAARVIAHRTQNAFKTVPIPLAVSARLLDADPLPMPALMERPFALVVGDASPRKNLRLVVDTWPDVLRQVPNAVLAMVGPSGWGTNDYGAHSQRLFAAGQFLPLGHVNDGELSWLYQNCVATLCPSRLEGFGLPAAEAVAFGAHLLRSDDPALREASCGAGIELDADDSKGWAREISSALRTERRRERQVKPRLWVDVVRESLAAVETSLRVRA